jgi:hypothetical protein
METRKSRESRDQSLFPKIGGIDKIQKIHLRDSFYVISFLQNEKASNNGPCADRPEMGSVHKDSLKVQTQIHSMVACL